MSSTETYFLSFLEALNPTASHNARKMEELLYEDPASSIVKARLFAESILNDVFNQEKIEAPYVNSLFERIAFLTKEGYIEKEIQQAFDTIRRSGNKAAHDGSFNEITDAFKLHREMHRIGVWYYEVYSLEQLKFPLYETPKPPKENVEEIIKKQILEFLNVNKMNNLGVVLETPSIKVDTLPAYDEIEEEIIEKDLKEDQSYLIRELNRLKDSSQEAIENASKFSRFKDYLHIDRKIQIDFERILEEKASNPKGNLIFLCGSVGDGKSHLLAYVSKKKPQLINEYKIYNDATESFSPNKNAMETLEEALKGFSDQLYASNSENVILAINMGVLHNFIHSVHNTYSFERLKSFVNQSGLFSQNVTTEYSEGNLSLLSFGDYHPFELTEEGPISIFYSSLLKKICSSENQNPFYLAAKEDEKNKIYTIVHENYNYLKNEAVQKQIVYLIIKTIIKNKVVISARSFLNFVADILIPDQVMSRQLVSDFDLLKGSLPNLLFARKERSTLLNSMSQNDPIHIRSVYIDQLVIDFNTLDNWRDLVKEYVHDNISLKWMDPFLFDSELTGYSFNQFFEAFIRIAYLSNQDFSQKLIDESYKKYMENLYSFNTKNPQKIKTFYEEIKSAIFDWRGSPKKDYIYLSTTESKFRFAQKMNLKPSIDHLKPNNQTVLESFKSTILLAYHGGDASKKIFLEIDYPLYQLISKVLNGYRPNKKDTEDAIRFVEFIDKLMAFGEKTNEMLIFYPNDNRFYTIKRDDFEGFVFEREF